MKNKIVLAVIGILLVIATLLIGCSKGQSTTTTTSQQPVAATSSTQTSQLTSTTSTTSAITTTKTSPAPITSTLTNANTSTKTNWWDKFGEPQYGGEITTVKSAVAPVFDPYAGGYPGWQPWLEGLLAWDWKLDRTIWGFGNQYVPLEYNVGHLAESWEQQDAKTMVFHIRKGIKWQDKPPVNGRDFNAHDVQYHYDRILGTGSGSSIPSKFTMWLSFLEKVTATDDYTVEFRFKEAGFGGVWQIIDMITLNFPVPHEWVEQGDLNNWQNVVGTGPWILTDFVSGSTMSVTPNKNYWDYDERHPENRLPYADKLTAVAIPDLSTKLAALRTGKIDILAGLSIQHAELLKQTNSELKVLQVAPSSSLGLMMRCDKSPFTDIRVRKALQMSIDLDTIAKTYFKGAVSGIPAGLVIADYKGYCFQYDKWPQELKDEYSYNLSGARQLLTEAGYPNGFQTSVITSAMFDQELLQIIKGYFSEISVDMEIKTYDVTSYFAFASSGKHDQIACFGKTPATNPQKIVRTYYSKNPADNFSFNNDAGYDAIVEKFSAATTMSEVAQYMIEADKYFLEKHWAISTLPNPSNVAYQPYIMGYSGEVIQASWNDWFHLTRLWVDQDMKKSMRK